MKAPAYLGGKEIPRFLEQKHVGNYASCNRDKELPEVSEWVHFFPIAELGDMSLSGSLVFTQVFNWFSPKISRDTPCVTCSPEFKLSSGGKNIWHFIKGVAHFCLLF